MKTLVRSEIAFCCEPIIAYVAGVWTLIGTSKLGHGAGRLRSSRSLGQCVAFLNRFIRGALHIGKLATLGAECRVVRITVGGLFNVHFLLERSLDGAKNQILARPQIACEFSQERQPNAESRQILARADGGADESRDRSIENLVRQCGVV